MRGRKTKDWKSVGRIPLAVRSGRILDQHTLGTNLVGRDTRRPVLGIGIDFFNGG